MNNQQPPFQGAQPFRPAGFQPHGAPFNPGQQLQSQQQTSSQTSSQASSGGGSSTTNNSSEVGRPSLGITPGGMNIRPPNATFPQSLGSGPPIVPNSSPGMTQQHPPHSAGPTYGAPPSATQTGFGSQLRPQGIPNSNPSPPSQRMNPPPPAGLNYGGPPTGQQQQQPPARTQSTPMFHNVPPQLSPQTYSASQTYSAPSTAAFAQMSLRGPPTGHGSAPPTTGFTSGQPPMNAGQPPMNAGQPPMNTGQPSPNPSFSSGTTQNVGQGSYPQQNLPSGAYQQPAEFRSNDSMGGGQMQSPLLDPLLGAQCDPRFMTITVNSIPNSQDIASKSNIPIGVVIRPLAPIGKGEKPIDIVNFGSNGVIRCKRCRTYINPFVHWVDNGRRWRCNICGTANDVPSSYFCHLGADGMRQDREQRPELSTGNVEIVAPAEYMMRPPQPPVFMFVIDVSVTAVQSGLLKTCIETIKSKLDELPGNPRTRVGIVTFDSFVHFYNLKCTLKTPQMMVVPDISELFIPIPDDLLVNLREVIDTLLDMLPVMHQNTRNVETALGPALRAAFRVMAHIGGKMCVFQSSLPSVGQGVLKHRDNPRALGTEKELALLTSVDNFYRQNAIEFSRNQVSVDLFLFSHQYTDAATLATLSKYSAGQLYYYPAFTETSYGEKFKAELGHCLTREIGWEAVMRVRCTQGMRLANFYGNSFMRGTDLLALPNVNEDSAYAIEIAHSDAVLTSSAISIQAALLYTTSCGERRIRVHTIAVPVSKIFAEIFRSVNIDVMCNLMAKIALEQALKSGIDSARMKLQTQCVDIIRSYRSSGAYGGQAHGYQLNLPESLQLLPLYTMSLIKNGALRGGGDVRTDERVFLMYELYNMNVFQSRVFIYPRLFALHNMPVECGQEMESEQEGDSPVIRLPPVLNLSIERLSSDGVFLLEDSIAIYLWFGRAVSSDFLNSVLNINSLEGVDINQLVLASPTDDLSQRVSNIIAAIRQERMPFMKVHILKEGDPTESRFFWKLVEDRASFPGGSYSYSEYLGHVNRQSHGSGS